METQTNVHKIFSTQVPPKGKNGISINHIKLYRFILLISL